MTLFNAATKPGQLNLSNVEVGEHEREHLTRLTEDQLSSYRAFLWNWLIAVDEEEVRRGFFQLSTLPGGVLSSPRSDFTPIYRDAESAIEALRAESAQVPVSALDRPVGEVDDAGGDESGPADMHSGGAEPNMLSGTGEGENG